MKIIAVPDSFKGSMCAATAAQAIERGAKEANPETEVIRLPISDGGEGFVDALIAAKNGRKLTYSVHDPLGRKIDASFGLIDGDRTAVIEVAAASGLPLLLPEERDPICTSTFGTGELILAALDQGCDQILIGLGGSATNDGGIGMAQALGYEFYDANANKVAPYSPQWLDITRINSQHRDERLDRVRFLAACDVETVLYGAEGASYIFGPQKGAKPDQVKRLDKMLEKLAYILESDLGVNIHMLSGGGAAGGLGAGMAAFIGAELVPGADLVLRTIEFEQYLKNCDLVITGEGQTDGQSVLGKAPAVVAKMAAAHGVPAICISGGLAQGYEDLKKSGIAALFSIAPGPCDLDTAMLKAEEWMAQTVREVVDLLYKVENKR